MPRRVPPPEALPPSDWAALPTALLHTIFSLLPADSRLLAAATCRSWRSDAADATLWRHLAVTSATSAPKQRQELLHAAAARAQGALESLDATGVPRLSSPRVFTGLLDLLRANAGTLSALRLPSVEGYQAERVAELLLPRALTRLSLSTMTLRTGATLDQLALVGQPRVSVGGCELVGEGEAFYDTGLLVNLLAMAGRDSLRKLHLLGFGIADDLFAGGQRAAGLAEDAGLTHLRFSRCRWAVPHGAATLLTALLRLPQLVELRVAQAETHFYEPLLLSAHVPALAEALRSAPALTVLTLDACGLFLEPRVGLAVVDALVGHPSLRVLSLCGNQPRREGAKGEHPQKEAGEALRRLLAADAALRCLRVEGCALGPEGLAPLLTGLRSNRSLRELWLARNGVTEEFAAAKLLPAVRANRSLRRLEAEKRGSFKEAALGVAARAAGVVWFEGAPDAEGREAEERRMVAAAAAVARDSDSD